MTLRLYAGFPVVLVALIAIAGCSDTDDPVLAPVPPPPPSFQDLTEKAHVIDNLVLSYTERDLDELDTLLDTGFFFLFSAADVASLGIPSSWGRADEMIASNAIVGSGSTGPDSIVTINVEIPYDTLHWDETLVVGPGGIETWYVTTLSYNFAFKTAGDITFKGSSMEAIFTVRNAGAVDSPEWRLVRWEDLGGGAAVTNGPTGSSAVEEVTWGRVKELYNPQPRPFADLSQKNDVIHNLTMSYLLRDLNQYKRILDADYYRFFFSDGDVANGLPSDGWDRIQDEAATTNLLNRSSSAPNRIVSLDLNVEQRNLIWVELAADPPLTETWWSVTTNYSFTFKTANDISYITSGSPRTQFIVRNIGTDQTPQWRLVLWRDLGNEGRAGRSAVIVEAKTWGRVKSLYAN